MINLNTVTTTPSSKSPTVPFRPLFRGGCSKTRSTTLLGHCHGPLYQNFAVCYTRFVFTVLPKMGLDDLIAFGADVELQFSDGTLMANSTALSLFSSVLRGAVEANAGKVSGNSSGTPNSSSSRPHKQRKKDNSIPMEGVKKEEWLQVAAFWYPVVPAPTIESWQQAELLLRVGSQFDLQLVLHKVDLYLREHANELTAGAYAGGFAFAGSSASAPETQTVWKWLQLADKSGLTECLAALGARAAEVDWRACGSDENLQGLSIAAMKELIKAMVPKHRPNCSSCTRNW